ncbi:two-component sensor histidine kinase [Planobispora takensis]|uniref:histidine kinase n=1 Tax=Planobispora takensis TaxID=1367882 RepID=A0A8J3T5D5_9ACTN|nr:histidine kinase [Planobispora takensis]GII04425.1 two-component sensor histidine kinase [Planobispora takensis]
MLRPAPGHWRPTWLDLLLSLAVTVSGLVESFGRQGPDYGQIHNPVPWAAGAVTAGVMLLARRRFPAIMLMLLVAVGLVLRHVTDDGYYAAWHLYSMLILIHTVASARELRSPQGAAGLGCVLGAYAFLLTLNDSDIAETMISAIFVGVAYGSGILLRRQIDRTLRLTERATRLEVEREERARRAVEEERARIARELHDVISHNVSVMTLHAGGVRMLLGTRGEHDREREMLSGIEEAGREAIRELQLMLGVLRGSEDHDSEPFQPDLDRLDELVQRVRGTGLEVSLLIAGEPRPLPPEIGLSAYRVIQEALTNVRKHAGGAGARVVVAYGRDGLVAEIVNDGTGAGWSESGPTGRDPGGEPREPTGRDPAGGGPDDRGPDGRGPGGHGPDGRGPGGHGPDGRGPGGHGLIGMRERTAMHGGELSAGPLPGGGYAVVARFPLGVPMETG